MVPLGFALPGRMLEAMERAIAQAEPGGAPFVGCAPADFDAVIGPEGLDGPGALAHRADCAPAPELLRVT